MKTESDMSNPRRMVDCYTGKTYEFAVWDFKSMSPKTFKKRFRDEIQTPLQKALQEHGTNPNVQLSPAFLPSMRGLVHQLAMLHLYMFSITSSTDVTIIQKRLGLQHGNKVALVRFNGMNKLRKACLALCGAHMQFNMPLISEDLNKLRTMYPEPGFSSQMTTVELGCKQPGDDTFPLLFVIGIKELAPTKCPDTFLNAQIVKLHSKELLTRDVVQTYSANDNEAPPPYVKFHLALCKDPELSKYLEGVCSMCYGSGVFKLQQCSGCKVALYCCEEHQTAHWRVHKDHCKKLYTLKMSCSNK